MKKLIGRLATALSDPTSGESAKEHCHRLIHFSNHFFKLIYQFYHHWRPISKCFHVYAFQGISKSLRQAAKSAKLCNLLAACFENTVAAKYINTRSRDRSQNISETVHKFVKANFKRRFWWIESDFPFFTRPDFF